MKIMALGREVFCDRERKRKKEKEQSGNESRNNNQTKESIASLLMNECCGNCNTIDILINEQTNHSNDQKMLHTLEFCLQT